MNAAIPERAGVVGLLASYSATLGCLALLVASGCQGSTKGAATASSPPPSEWQKPLDFSSLPVLQNNASSDADITWAYANATLGAEVWILEDGPNAGARDDFAADPSLLDVPLTDTGWPRELRDGFVVTLGAHYVRHAAPGPGELRSTKMESLTGLFVINWQGKTLPDANGKSQFRVLDTINDGNPTIGTQVLAAGDHRIVAKVRDTGRGVQVWYHKPDPSDPIRDVKIWVPKDMGLGLDVDVSSYDPDKLGPGKLTGYCTEPAPGEPEPRWHPKYLEHLRSDPGRVLRFMAFLDINGIADGGPATWEDCLAPTVTVARLVGVSPSNYVRHELTTSKYKCGTPYEWLVDLANTSGKDAWLQVPHTATMDHVAHLATLAAAKLDPGLRAWFEFSNELWNSAGPYLPQYDAARAEGALYGKSQGWGSGHLQGRALQAFENAWYQAGGTDDRLINVVSGFALGPAYNADVIAGAAAVSPTLPEVLAITTYFGASLTNVLYDLPYVSGNPGEPVYLEARERIRHAIYDNQAAWAANGKLCTEQGLAMVAYEGGSHLLATGHGDWNVPRDAAFMTFLANLHKYPVMADLYREHWALWAAEGGRTASLFVDISGYSYWGYWGAKEDVAEPTARSPRWRAAQEFAAAQAGIRSMDQPKGTRPRIQGGTLMRAEVGQPFSATLTATGGDGAISLVVLGGRLPAGVTATPSTGTLTLSGTPSDLETARFVVRASDADGDPDYAVYTVEVDPPGTAANHLILVDTAQLPMASLVLSENNEAYRTRFDTSRSFTNDTTAHPPRTYLSFDGAAPCFSHHYQDATLTLATSSPFNFSGGWSLGFLEDEFNAANTTADDGAPVVWDWAHNSGVLWFGWRNRSLSGWVGASLDLPADATHSQARRYGVPTDFDALVVWRKDQMDLPSASATVGFGAGAAQSSMVLELNGISSDSALVRFVVRHHDGDGTTRYYLSEAAWDKTYAGRFALTDFDDRSDAGKRWAVFTPSATSFAMPNASALTFQAKKFTDVDGVGIAVSSHRGGWHYDMGLSRFVVIGTK
jgi:hypothetical protein